MEPGYLGEGSASQSSLSQEERERLQKQVEKSLKAAQEEREYREQEAAAYALMKWNQCHESGQSPYLESKRIDNCGARFHDSFLLIPLRDTQEKIWSLQWIRSDGSKRFLRSGRKKGRFHHMGNLVDGQPIIITEGYATGGSVYMATQTPTVIAFDSGNLEPVVEELRKAYPFSPLMIGGDDDCWGEENVGRTKSEAIGEKHNIPILFPQFKDTTNPTNLSPSRRFVGWRRGGV